MWKDLHVINLDCKYIYWWNTYHHYVGIIQELKQLQDMVEKYSFGWNPRRFLFTSVVVTWPDKHLYDYIAMFSSIFFNNV